MAKLTTRKALFIGAALVLLSAAYAGGRLLIPRLTQGNRPAPSPQPGGQLTEIRNPEAGVSISIPRTWKREKSEDPQVVVVAQRENDSFRLSVAPLKGTVSAEAFKELGPGFRQQIEEEGNVIGFLAEPKPITLQGVVGWHYIYTFVEPLSGEEGVRSRYFLFHGAKLIQMIFQTRPVMNFPNAAPVFDRISETLVSQPRLVKEEGEPPPGGAPQEAPAGQP